MNMKVKLRQADEVIVELKRSRNRYRDLAIIFGCVILGLSVTLYGIVTSL